MLFLVILMEGEVINSLRNGSNKTSKNEIKTLEYMELFSTQSGLHLEMVANKQVSD